MELSPPSPVVHAPQRLDALTAMAFKRAARELLMKGSSEVVLDLSSLSAIDASGMAAVLSLSRSARAAGGRVITRGGSPEIKSAFTLTGLESLVAES